MMSYSSRRKRAVISCGECHRRKQKCDRRQPCAQCVKRGKRDACYYELDNTREAPSTTSTNPEIQCTNSTLQPYSHLISAATPAMEDELKQLGYTDSATGTASLVQGLSQLNTTRNVPQLASPAATSYASLIRLLPSRKHIDILTRCFFQNVAWNYDVVNEDIFSSQLAQWNSLAYSQLKQAPASLPTGLQAFPLLLHQVLAQGLLFQPIEYDDSIEELKYTADMDLSDRAAEFSDAGHQLASCFRKSELTLTMVQAGLMRTIFQKTTGEVVEAWHTLGAAIHDAQELGLHMLESESTESSIPGQISERELGHRVWLMLHIWDNHMAIVLGRPMLTRISPEAVPSPMSWSRNSAIPELPTARDVILCGYHTAYKFLQNIRDLEQETLEISLPHVENIHKQISTNIINLPGWAATQRPRLAEPFWLSAAIESMHTNVHFALFALHRPFIFAEQTSRERAFDAALQILESQARVFDLTQKVRYTSFTMVFATFDAMVLIAALQIRFPDEFAGRLPVTRTSLEWGLRMLNALKIKVKLAGSAFAVVERLYRKLLAATLPVQEWDAAQNTTEISQTLVETDNEMMSQIDWDSALQSKFDVIHAHPFDDLLYSSTLDIYPEDHKDLK